MAYKRPSTGNTVPIHSASTGIFSRDAELMQVDLPLEEGANGRVRTLMKHIRDAVEELGAKEVAFALDVSPSQLSHALAGRHRLHVPVEWLVHLVSRARAGEQIAKFFAALRGYELAPRRELTPEEQLERLKTALSKNLGPELQRVVLADAFGEDE